MKKAQILILALMMILGLIGCTQSANTNETAVSETNEDILLSGIWTDGTYTLTFRSNNTAQFKGGEKPNDVKWSLDDNYITLEWMGMIDVYTLEKENDQYILISPDDTVFTLEK